MWCVGCGVPGVYICSNCAKTLPFIRFQRCAVCHGVSDYGKTHISCAKQTTNTASYIYSFLNYYGIVRSIMRKAKFYPDPALFKALIASIPLRFHLDMVTVIRRNGIGGIVPIPVSNIQRNWRGYNQSRLFAEYLGFLLEIPVFDALIRTGEYALQSQTKPIARPKNISGLFNVCNKAIKKIGNSPILLCDDIITTGSTLREASKILTTRNIRCQCWVTVCRSF